MQSCNFLSAKIIYVVIIGSTIGCSSDTVTTPSADAVPQTETQLRHYRGVGIVNMQRVADALGITSQLNEKQKKMQETWKQADSDTRKAIEATLNKFGGDPKTLSDIQRQELQELERARIRTLSKIDQENASAMQETNRWLRRVLSEKTRDSIRSIGEEMGFDVILIKAPGEVAFIVPEVDVTDQVIQRSGGATEDESARTTPEKASKSTPQPGNG